MYSKTRCEKRKNAKDLQKRCLLHKLRKKTYFSEYHTRLIKLKDLITIYYEQAIVFTGSLPVSGTINERCNNEITCNNQKILKIFIYILDKPANLKLSENRSCTQQHSLILPYRSSDKNRVYFSTDYLALSFVGIQHSVS